jgi:uncharacterized protein YndB with AHSA1/START domain
MTATQTKSKEFTIERVFDAPRQMVWDAFTQSRHLKRWWGPKGFKMLACTLDLRPGGVFHYGMLAPNGQEMWGKWTFREVVPPEKLSMVISFSDKDQGVTRHPFAPDWPAEMFGTNTFTAQGNKTVLTTRTIAFNATDGERKAFETGFASMEQGFSGTFDQLDAYLGEMS